MLVLDDFHLIREQAIHEDVAYFLERTPPGVHLAIASRAAPPVGVARLRVRGELGEVAEEELRFDRAGVGQLLNDGLGLTLADGDIDLLLERTEGWAAGLYLAGLSLQSRSDGAEFIASFSGAQRHLADYLLEEVLAGQPDELRRFLVQTSVLDRLSAPLCDALLGTGGSREPAGADRAVESVPDPARLAPGVVPLPPPVPGPAAPRAGPRRHRGGDPRPAPPGGGVARGERPDR